MSGQYAPHQQQPQYGYNPQQQQQQQYPAYGYQQPPSGQPQYYPQGAPPPPQQQGSISPQPGSYAPPQSAYGQPPPTTYPQSNPQQQQQHQYPAYGYQQPPSGQPQYYPQPGAQQGSIAPQPGSYAPPQGAYGQPPPTTYPQSNVPHTNETPPHVRQDYAPPPPQGSYASPPPQGAYGQPPPPTYPQSSVLHTNETSPPHVKQDPRLVTFKFSGTKATIRDARVIDQWGRTVSTISSTKKKTTMCNMSGHPVAVIEWNHSHPHIVYHGEETKSRDFLPLDRKQMVRGMKHNGQMYGWKGSEDKMLVELFATSAPSKRLAYWHTEEDENKQSVIYLEALPEVYETGMLDICLIAVFLMNCGTALEDHSYNPPFVLINVLSALINAA